MGPLKILYAGIHFNPELPKSTIFLRFLKEGDSIVEKPEDANVVIISDTITTEEISILQEKFNGCTIQYIAEPIVNMTLLASEFNIARQLYLKKICNIIIGCVCNDFTHQLIKYPLYAYDREMLEQETFNEVNTMVSLSTPIEKEFCALVNRHDWGDTRIIMYKKIKDYGHIVCPGKLLNNCSNEEINTIGNKEYFKKFRFVICSENFGNDHPGYITEKLMNVCLGGAIPIYCGALDEVDEKIFNKGRILFYDKLTVDTIAEKIGELNSDENKLNEFYKQPVFMPEAANEIRKMNTNMYNLFENIRRLV